MKLPAKYYYVKQNWKEIIVLDNLIISKYLKLWNQINNKSKDCQAIKFVWGHNGYINERKNEIHSIVIKYAEENIHRIKCAQLFTKIQFILGLAKLYVGIWFGIGKRQPTPF